MDGSGLERKDLRGIKGPFIAIDGGLSGNGGGPLSSPPDLGSGTGVGLRRGGVGGAFGGCSSVGEGRGCFGAGTEDVLAL